MVTVTMAITVNEMVKEILMLLMVTTMMETQTVI
jgi:hypothetical protein